MANIPIIGPLQMLYFWFKNRRRAREMKAWADGMGFQFAANGGDFDAPANPGRSQDASHIGKHSSKAVGIFSRMIGMSKIQAAFPQFVSNRFRGEWQSDKNICWGSYRGTTVIVWDTVYYDISVGGSDTDWSEGEYSSVLVLTETPIHRTFITPNSLGKRLSAFGIEEGFGSFRMSNVQFELEAFNKAYKVKAKDQKWAFAIIDQEMMEWLLEQKKHTIELAPGGVAESTWFMMPTDRIEKELDFVINFLDRFPQDLKRAEADGTTN